MTSGAVEKNENAATPHAKFGRCRHLGHELRKLPRQAGKTLNDPSKEHIHVRSIHVLIVKDLIINVVVSSLQIGIHGAQGTTRNTYGIDALNEQWLRVTTSRRQKCDSGVKLADAARVLLVAANPLVNLGQKFCPRRVVVVGIL